jgi:hypothetical protein
LSTEIMYAHFSLACWVIPSSLIWSPKLIWWRVLIMNLLIMHLCPASSYFLTFSSKHSSPHFVFNQPVLTGLGPLNLACSV